ncbi:conserved unknown protein [Ectocarpus siliculosus]|uniref:Chromate transporter n=1 Tax=Ectocarpus siliculosus TaxID=2880 RepID=D7FM24_ECTSI|nr:conserved unknown protein [Ectocarpus siliculosus]|eukprot:CBJ29849.1 conserved unknown protein [Ectocarpus siliculosus]
MTVPVEDPSEADLPFSERIKQVFWQFLPLGVVAYGGPTAHIALLHERFVDKSKWLSEEQFVELMAVGQGLPGPTSTQMVVSMGAYRAGIPGGLLSFALWNIPSFIVLTLAGLGVKELLGDDDPDWLSGLGPAAISLVFVAAYKLGKKVNKSPLKFSLSLVSACVTLLINGDEDINPNVSAWVFPLMLVCGGLVMLADSKAELALEGKTYSRINIPMWLGGAIAVGWATILVVSISAFPGSGLGGLFKAFFRIGSIIYGGGQVVLPMLVDEVVDPGWLTEKQFYQGFALVQALPGPLFNLSAYLGAVYRGVPGAFVGWLGLFGPGVSLIFGFLPFWGTIRKVAWFKIFLQGVNSTAIGLVVAACVLLWGAAIDSYADAIVAVVAGCMQAFLGFQAPWCILAGGVLGFLLSDTLASLGQAPFFPIEG